MTLGGYTLAPGPEWTAAAARWPLVTVSRETEPGHMLVEAAHLERGGRPLPQTHLVCGECRQSVCCLAPDATRDGYVLDVARIQAGVLAHVRQSHSDRVTV